MVHAAQKKHFGKWQEKAYARLHHLPGSARGSHAHRHSKKVFSVISSFLHMSKENTNPSAIHHTNNAQS